MNKKIIIVLLTAALLAGCADKGSDSKGYVDLDSVKEEQQELVENQSVFEFSQDGEFKYDDKPWNIMKLSLTELDSHIFYFSGLANIVLDTETDSFSHLCRIAGCAHSDNSPGCLDHLQMGCSVATSRGLYFPDYSKLMLFDGSEQRLIYVNKFSTDYLKKVHPESHDALDGIMIQAGRCFLLGGDFYIPFDLEAGKPSGEPVVLTEESVIYSYCANSEYMFYSTENNELFSCRLADNEIAKLDDKVGQVCVSGDRLYYVKWEGEVSTLMRADKDGKNAEAFIKECYINYVITDKAVYYTHFKKDDGIVYVYDLATGQTEQVDISYTIHEDDPDTEEDETLTYPQENFAPYFVWNKKSDKVYLIDELTEEGRGMTGKRIWYIFKNGSTEFEVKTDA